MNVEFDVLDDILSMIRLNFSFYFERAFVGDWGIEAQKSSYRKFHIIVQGECWLRAPFLTEPLQLRKGDIIAFPQGDTFQLSAAPDSACVLQDDFVTGYPEHKPESDLASATRIIFGNIAFVREPRHPIVHNLPAFIYLPMGGEPQRSKLAALADLLIEETRSALPGSLSVGRRLAEALHLYSLRTYILTQQQTYLGVFNDPLIYRALQMIHSALDTEWTLEAIATEIGMSRTSFATRFREVVGMTPMRYITQWRMQKARELLDTTNLTLERVSRAVGYQSEAAFARAFQREFGQTPGQSRQSRTPSAME